MKQIAFSILMLNFFVNLQAQDVAISEDEQRSMIFESASFSNVDDCERITVTCRRSADLTDFEFKGKDSYMYFSWSDSDDRSTTFPMKLNVKPGKVKIRYRMKNQEWKTIQMDLEKGNSLTINID